MLFVLEVLYGLGIFMSYPLNLSPIYEIITKSEKFARFFNTDSVDERFDGREASTGETEE